MYLANTAAYAGPQVGFRFPQGVIVVAGVVLTPPLIPVLVGSGQYICGDDGVAYQAVLTSSDGPVDLSSFSGGFLHIQYANGDLALTAAVTIADQTVLANLGLVTVAGFGLTLTRASRATHEVRMQKADGTFVTFRGNNRLSILLPFTTP